MKFSIHFLLVFALLFAGLLNASYSEEKVLARVEVIAKVADITLPMYAHLQDGAGRDYVLVMAEVSQLDRNKLSYEILDFPVNKKEGQFYFIALEKKKGARDQAQEFIQVLHDDGRHVVVRGTQEQAESLTTIGFEIEEIETPMVIRENRFETKEVSYLPMVAQMVGEVEQKNLYTYVGNLSGEWPVTIGGTSYTIVSRYTKSGEPITKATQYAYEFMQKLGLTVSYHEWSSWSGSCRNVVGNKPGVTKPKEIVLVVGHFDCVPSSATNSPGADDNASGSVGVMTAAEIFSRYSFERTLRFVLFTGEEQGLYGSKAYADKVAQDGENIVAVYNMDMIAWDSVGGPTLRLHTRTSSSSGHTADKAIANVFIETNKVYQTNLSPILDADGITASDHSSFWKKGYAAILAIEDDDDDFCKNYHTSRDKLATLNMTYFTNYVKCTIGTLAHLAIPVQNQSFWPFELYEGVLPH